MSMMNRTQFLREDHGVALITVVLMSSLVVGLIILALANGMTGRVVSTTYVAGRQDAQCGRGNLDVAEEMLKIVASEHDASKLTALNEKTAIIKVDPKIVDIIVTRSTTTTVSDQDKKAVDEGGNVDAEITINARDGKDRDCTTVVDIDKLFMRINREGEPVAQTASGYDEDVHGKACPNGNVYVVTTETSNAQTRASSRFRSVYYDCPG